MKVSATAFLVPLFLASITVAAPVEQAAIGSWTLKLTNTKGGTYNMHGRKNSNCKNIELENKYPISRAEYKDNLFSDTFELYAQQNCKGPVSYRNDQGNYDLKPSRMIYSYKVY